MHTLHNCMLTCIDIIINIKGTHNKVHTICVICACISQGHPYCEVFVCNGKSAFKLIMIHLAMNVW